MFKLPQELQDKFAAKSATMNVLRNTLMQGEANTQRSLNEVKASLMDMVETFALRAAKRDASSSF